MKIHHGGFFTEPPGRTYTNGKHNYVDFIDVDLFSVIELNDMVKMLGYKGKGCKMFYHWRVPNSELDYGLQALGGDMDVLNLVGYANKIKLIDVYIEHDYTVLDTYLKSPFTSPQKVILEEIDVEETSALVKKTIKKPALNSSLVRMPFKKPGLKETRLPMLLLEDGPSENANVDGPPMNANVDGPSVPVDGDAPIFNEAASVNETSDACNSESFSGEYETSSETDDSQDSDYIQTDEEHEINEVDVDMEEFYKNVDTDAEWAGVRNDNASETVDLGVEEAYDLDDFDMPMYIESESETESVNGKNTNRRKRAMANLRKEEAHHSGSVGQSKESFFVGRQFGNKKEISAMVNEVAVATRRQLYTWKNDKQRVRVVCRGKCPVFTESTGPTKASGSNTSGPNDVGQGINKVGGLRIKVGGKKGSYIYEHITCPWTLHISNDNQGTWTVQTLNDSHDCLQTRDVKKCTNKFLSKDIEEVIKPNPEIPIKALKEQLQQKYQLNISTSKIKRAKGQAVMKVKGDFSEQYGGIRDYVLELQRSNEDTTVKLDLERDYNPNDTTRQFKRIYVCIGALKRGFKEGLRDLLGLDGCFMKGKYPGQLLTAVGIDANHGTYPLAYAIVEAENMSAWCWFLTCLGDDLDLGPMSNFTFITDRQKVNFLNSYLFIKCV